MATSTGAGSPTVTVTAISTAAPAITSAPLTTTFTPAASCTNDFYTNTESNWYSIGGPSASQCFPPGWDSTSQYFSPGICPQGYTQACSGSYGSETRATCCPSAYACYTLTDFNFIGQACVSLFTSQVTTTVTDGSALTILLATLHPKTEAVNGYGISIRYDANDFGSSTSSSMTTSSSSSAPSSNSNTNSQTSSPVSSTTSSGSPSPSSSSSSGLSTGAKAGIGVGVAVVALVALFALVFWILKKKRNARAGTEYQVGPTGKEDWRVQTQPVHEVYTPPSELRGSTPRPIIEFDGSQNLR